MIACHKPTIKYQGYVGELPFKDVEEGNSTRASMIVIGK
jgi:hypothetical protein